MVFFSLWYYFLFVPDKPKNLRIEICDHYVTGILLTNSYIHYLSVWHQWIFEVFLNLMLDVFFYLWIFTAFNIFSSFFCFWNKKLSFYFDYFDLLFPSVVFIDVNINTTFQSICWPSWVFMQYCSFSGPKFYLVLWPSQKFFFLLVQTYFKFLIIICKKYYW